MIIFLCGVLDAKNECRFDKHDAYFKINHEVVLNPSLLDLSMPTENISNVCLNYVENCDIVFMLKGWENDFVACTCLRFANEIKKVVVYEEQLDGIA